MPETTFFAFDLDGTVTRAEILPAIAREAGLSGEIACLTTRTLDGDLDFSASFRLRFELLRHVPLAIVHRAVAAVPLDPHITAFIAENRERCAIVTGNLDCWIAPLTAGLGCAVHCSKAAVREGELSLASVLDKGEVVRAMTEAGKRVVAIGDAANDIPMFTEAALSIAYGGVREPAPGLAAVANLVVRDSPSLCRLLREIRDTGTLSAKAHCGKYNSFRQQTG